MYNIQLLSLSDLKVLEGVLSPSVDAHILDLVRAEMSSRIQGIRDRYPRANQVSSNQISLLDEIDKESLS
jgi:hypothetical protein